MEFFYQFCLLIQATFVGLNNFSMLLNLCHARFSSLSIVWVKLEISEKTIAANWRDSDMIKRLYFQPIANKLMIQLIKHVHQNQNVNSGGVQIKVLYLLGLNPQRKNNPGLPAENS